MNYYNENDQFNAQWLRNLVSAGLIPAGDVDGRCITDVSPSDLTGYTQCHFFAGIAGWSEALWLAGVDPSVRLWTGSCPCQPFSVAGKGKGTEDKRHLWPVFRKLIDHCRPPIIFGEQVASPAGINWFRAVRADLEALGYGVPGADLCSAGIGSPNIRQRIYWMAYSPGGGSGAGLCHREPGREWRDVDPHSRGNGGLADTIGSQFRRESGGGAGTTGGDEGEAPGKERERSWPDDGGGRSDGRVADADNQRRPEYVNEQGEWEKAGPHNSAERERIGCRVVDADGTGRGVISPDDNGISEVDGEDSGRGVPHSTGRSEARRSGAHDSPWRSPDWLLCQDGRWRPVEPGTFPLAYGIPQRVGRLRAYGNAICPPLAAAFIRAAMMP